MSLVFFPLMLTLFQNVILDDLLNGIVLINYGSLMNDYLRWDSLLLWGCIRMLEFIGLCLTDSDSLPPFNARCDY